MLNETLHKELNHYGSANANVLPDQARDLWKSLRSSGFTATEKYSNPSLTDGKLVYMFIPKEEYIAIRLRQLRLCS
jgi:hypothetical protein